MIVIQTRPLGWVDSQKKFLIEIMKLNHEISL